MPQVQIVRSRRCLARLSLIGLPVSIAVFLPACSGPGAYATGQSMQRFECDKLPGHEERLRCRESASRPYDSYEKEVESLKGSK